MKAKVIFLENNQIYQNQFYTFILNVSMTCWSYINRAPPKGFFCINLPFEQFYFVTPPVP